MIRNVFWQVASLSPKQIGFKTDPEGKTTVAF